MHSIMVLFLTTYLPQKLSFLNWKFGCADEPSQNWMFVCQKNLPPKSHSPMENSFFTFVFSTKLHRPNQTGLNSETSSLAVFLAWLLYEAEFASLYQVTSVSWRDAGDDSSINVKSWEFSRRLVKGALMFLARPLNSRWRYNAQV